MKGELLYAYNRNRWRVMWMVIYALVLVGVVTAVYLISSRIGTHSIPAGNVQLAVPYSKYLVGEPITFTLYNRFNSTIYVANTCPNEPLEVYRLVGTTWQRIHDQADIKDCAGENRQVPVPANGSVTGSFAPWKRLFAQPGKYRVAAYVEYYNALPYQDFEVITKPAAVVPSPTFQSGTGGGSQVTPTGEQIPGLQSRTVTTSGGTITVRYNAGTIYVVAIHPAVGYYYEGGGSGREVQVTFKGPNEVQVKLTLSGGQLQVDTEVGN